MQIEAPTADQCWISPGPRLDCRHGPLQKNRLSPHRREVSRVTPREPIRGEDVTVLLAASASGGVEARDRLAGILHAELHAMARARMRGERPDHTLGATALVNETFLRLFQTADHAETHADLSWRDRHAFFAAAATAMRRVLIDHARARATVKRGGGERPRTLVVEAAAVAAAQSLEPSDFLALDEAMGRLVSVDDRAAEVTRLKFFAGLDSNEIAELLGVSSRTVKRDWEFAKAWLAAFLADEKASDDQSEQA